MPPSASASDVDSIVVIGSGPPGAVAAMMLAQAGADVTLLEAGSAKRARGLTIRVGGLTVARFHRELHRRSEGISTTGEPTAVVYEDIAPGGLTNHWSCAVPRFSSFDFEDARRAGPEFEWPLDYADLEPWYDRVEPLLKISGATTGVAQVPAGKVKDPVALGPSWTPIVAAANLRGHDVLPVPYAYGASTTLTGSGTVFNSYVRLLQPVLRSGRLRVRHGAQVTALEWSGANRRVESVVYEDADTRALHKIGCRAVVVAAGTLNTAQILLQSRSQDFPDGLGNTHGVLGRYLHDHPLAKVGIELGSPVAFHPAAYVTRAPLDQSTALHAVACLQWSGMKSLARSLIGGHPGREAFCGFNLFGTMAPSAQNFVALNNHAEPTSREGLRLHIHRTQDAEITLAAAKDRLVEILDDAGLRPQIRSWTIDPIGSSIHYAGSCRMHRLPQFGMLDRWSRLHAVRNVIVVDSAAFPTGPEKNPALTAMALAARASHRLLEDLRSGAV